MSTKCYGRLVVRIAAFAALALVLCGPQKLLAFSLEGQNAPRTGSTNWSGGPLRGWYELEYIPCRVVLSPGSNQLVQINFDHTKNSSIVKRGIQNLFFFTPGSNVVMSAPVLTGTTADEEWYYTFTASVTNNQTGYVYYQARMAAGAHLFGGSSLDIFYPPLQLMKPAPSNGTPDLIITKSGPSTVYAGGTYTYSLIFSNKASAVSTAFGVQLSDFLPSGTTYVPGSFQGNNLVTNMTVEGNQIYWDLQDLPKGTSGTITYQVAVPSTFTNGAVIQNYAQIESAEDDANENDNISIVKSTVVRAPPIATPDAYSVNQNQTVTVSAPGVLANDTDPFNTALTANLVTNCDYGSVFLKGDGSFTYTPASNFTGTATFYYAVTNAYNATSAPVAVTINVWLFLPPPNTNVSCVSLVPSAATNLNQFIAQGGVASSPFCDQPTSVAYAGDVSNGGNGCAANPFVITRTYTITTGCGDVTNVTQNITVIDTTMPIIGGFPPDATYSCASQVPPADDKSVTATDNCSAITVTHDSDVINSGSCPNRFTITRMYHVADACGNTVGRSQRITVNDQTAPVIATFPADATYSCASGVPIANNSNVTATDGCGGMVVITHQPDSITSSNCLNRFTISRTYIATDACGNSSSQTQIITVNGTIPPTFTGFPADVTYTCASAVPVANDTVATAVSACGSSAEITITHDTDVVVSTNCENRFVLARTYRATDGCGNMTSKTQTISVNATAPPTITGFPLDATYSCPGGIPTADDSLVTAVSECGGNTGLVVAHFADLVTSSNCVGRFTLSRTYIITDSCGNSSSKTQKITVNATTAPTIVNFPADATYSCAATVPGANNSIVTAIDGCGGSNSIIITHAQDTIASSNCVSRFTIKRTYIATDACGNSSSKTQTITVNASNAPTITAFPSDATYLCANNVPAANDKLVSATDSCGTSTQVSITHLADLVTSSNCLNRFTIARTYVATDNCGNSTSRTQTISVNDTNAPIIANFPSDATYQCASAVPAANDTLVTATDGCGANSSIVITHFSDVVSSSNCVSRFRISRIYIATDACGNSSSRTQTITVNATTVPTIATFPADATYQCASAVPAPNDTLVTAIDGCGGTSSLIITHKPDSITSSNCMNRFTIARTYIATDACGNSSIKTQTITINATTVPTIATFPSDATYQCASAVPAPNDSLVNATDGCGNAFNLVITHKPDAISSSNCVNRFTISRTYIVTDACGNSSSKTQTITVNATNVPTIALFPADATYQCASAVPSANNALVTATDGCGNTNSLVITHPADLVTSSNCVNRFTISRTYIATDACGNSSSRTQLITVNATNVPIIAAFPADETYQCASAVPGANNNLVTAADGCGGTNKLVITHTPDIITSSNCVNRFTIARTYIATDACGNSSSKTQTITVNATTVPTIANFPADATYQCASAVPSANNGLVTATDGCGITSSLVITHMPDSISSSNCFNRFTIARTYIATDACGNSTSKTQKISVNGTIVPTIATFPADATYQCASAVPPASDGLVTAIDGCGTTSTIVITHKPDSVTSSNCVNRFTISRTYVATDACGNSTSKTQTITINATTTPTIATFPADATYQCASAVPSANNGLVTAVDGCGSTNKLIITHNPDIVTSSNCVNRFTIARTYIATDACGNSSSKTQIITVNGTTVPTIATFPADATYQCASSVPPAINTLVTAIDGCGVTSTIVITHKPDSVMSSNCVNRFTISRTYVATDACGNSTSRTQTITVNATTTPTIATFPADATYQCASDVPGANNGLVTATAGCGTTTSMVITHNPDITTSSNCVNRFTLLRTYVAADACGNSTSRTQTITVNATTPPTIATFPSDATYQCASAVPPPSDMLVSANDGCGVASNLVITHQLDLITSSNCINRFTISRTYIATDACGNSSSRTQTITVNATTPPTIATFPLDATYECAQAVPGADDSLVIASDGCGVASSLVITHSPDLLSSSNCVNRFTISRTYTATDACGNSTSRTQTITVHGTTPPTVTAFPPDATFACADSVPPADDSLVNAIDNCGSSSISVTHDSDVVLSNICANSFILARTYRVTDACGNATSQTQTITVHDTNPPEISCPSGFTAALFDDIPGPNTEAVTATDNCSVPLKSFVGETSVTNDYIVTITRVFAATDDCGNSSTCSQIITMNPFLATPVANPDSYSTLENQTLIVAAPGVLANDADPNNLPLQAILVSGPANGTLTFNGDGSFQYVPNTYFAGADSFTYQVSNGGTLSGPATVSLTVTFVNQPPSFTKGPNLIVNNYDSAQTRFGWASNISPGPANETSQTVHFNVSNDNNSIFSRQPEIAPDGTLTYAPAQGRYGSVNVSVALQDNGGTANGGIDTSPTQTFSIIVNNPPTAIINTPTNTSLFLYPTPVDITATAFDLDGTVTSVVFLNGTNVIGQGSAIGNNTYTFQWTNAPASNSVLYALATDNYGATNLSPPVSIQLGNPVNATGGPVAFSPSLYSWGQKISVTNPTISVVQCVTLTFTGVQPSGTSILGVTGTNDLGQPYITINSTVPPVSGIADYATVLYVAPTQPHVTFTTSASLMPGPGFSVNATNLIALTRHEFQTDGSFLINFMSKTNRTYYIQYTSDLTTWFTSPVTLKGTGTQMQWIDVGPNTTDSKPKSVPSRTYRVVSP